MNVFTREARLGVECEKFRRVSKHLARILNALRKNSQKRSPEDERTLHAKPLSLYQLPFDPSPEYISGSHLISQACLRRHKIPLILCTLSCTR